MLQVVLASLSLDKINEEKQSPRNTTMNCLGELNLRLPLSRDGHGDGSGPETTISTPNPQTSYSYPSPIQSPTGIYFYPPSPLQMGNGDPHGDFGDPIIFPRVTSK